jgi:CRISPR-associated endonuclease/helicase Cas3
VLYFSAQKAPACFGEHPLLRYLKPLPFEGGIARIGSLSLRLDKELGLVYE